MNLPTSHRPPDANERETSINPRHSYIVRAPAGSGKTALLTQRFLTLLVLVDEPEEIIAITFTRKACAAMRQRIIEALILAADPPIDEEASFTPHQQHKQHLHTLAKRAAQRDRQRQWCLTQHPTRLRILTIDALAHSLVRNMPWLARLGSAPIITDNPNDLYQLAIRRVLDELTTAPWGHSDLAKVLAYQDGNIVRLEQLLIHFLQHREQYLSWFVPDLEQARGFLEAALARTVKAQIQRFPASFLKIIEQLRGIARDAVAASEVIPDTPLAHLAQTQNSDALPEQCVLWHNLAELLLTNAGCWRKRLDKRQGFPSAKTPSNIDRKGEILELLQQLTDGEDAGQPLQPLSQALHQMRDLPTHYSEDEWQQLKSLIRLAHRTVASLRVVFGERQQVDFAEVTLSAISALGTEEAPTDLGLAMDYRIRHLLIDEYQDTSRSHHTLITRLLAGWLPDDGRTLFVVGDPMQSIYRFRQADVGLFMDSIKDGIAGVELKPLQLRTNFRSCDGIVAWVNRTFKEILPPKDDPVSGAVSFTEAESFDASAATSTTPQAVALHAFNSGEENTEAKHLAHLIAAEQRQNPDPKHKIAVLVRARTHVNALLPQLNKRHIAWCGINLQPLREVPLVIDLMSLARALCHTADRVAWLAVLRAPWCGLSLAALRQLVDYQPHTLIIDILGDTAHLESLKNKDAQQRCQRVQRIMTAALAQRGQRSLRRNVEGSWLALGGPACVPPAALVDVERFLQRLDEVELENGSVDPDQINMLVDDLYAAPQNQDGAVEIMTIHQAKGLEFDTVFLPGLNHRSSHDEHRFIEALQITNPDGYDNDLLLAPWSLPGKDNRIRAFINRIEGERQRNETKRLAYVATTRAGKRLHLLACFDSAPVRGSLLGVLWPAIKDQHRAATETTIGAKEENGEREGEAVQATHLPQRLPSNWTSPALPQELCWHAAAALDAASPITATPITFAWASHTAIKIGDLVHRLLQRIANEGLTHWSEDRVQRAQAIWRNWLAAAGVSRAELDNATQRVQCAIIAILRDQRGRWLLHPHNDACSELSLSAMERGQVVQFRIDRTFIDEHGRRFIVDYKSGYHSGSNLEQFLDREQHRYSEQLERYARLFLAKDGGRAHLGLYFPLHQGWREWEFEVV